VVVVVGDCDDGWMMVQIDKNQKQCVKQRTNENEHRRKMKPKK
jgi:hypothetical protein